MIVESKILMAMHLQVRMMNCFQVMITTASTTSSAWRLMMRRRICEVVDRGKATPSRPPPPTPSPRYLLYLLPPLIRLSTKRKPGNKHWGFTVWGKLYTSRQIVSHIPVKTWSYGIPTLWTLGTYDWTLKQRQAMYVYHNREQLTTVCRNEWSKPPALSTRLVKWLVHCTQDLACRVTAQTNCFMVFCFCRFCENADKVWQSYLDKHPSVLVKTFQGQFKSTVSRRIFVVSQMCYANSS